MNSKNPKMCGLKGIYCNRRQKLRPPKIFRKIRFNLLIALLVFCLAICGVSVGAEMGGGAGSINSSGFLLSENLVLGSEGTLGKISDCAVSSKGEVLLLDRGFYCVHRYSENGEYLGRFGAEGDGPGDLRHPTAIGIGPKGDVFIGGMGGRIEMFTSDGVSSGGFKRTENTISSRVMDIVVDGDGFIYVCSVNVIEQKVVAKYDARSFSPILQFVDTYAVGHDVDTRAERVFGGGFLCLSENNHLIFTQFVPPVVEEYSLDGQLRATYKIRFSDGEFPQYEVDGARIIFKSPKLISGRTVSLGLDGFLTSALVRENPEQGTDPESEGRVELTMYDKQWHIVGTAEMQREAAVLTADAIGRIYVLEERGNVDELVPVVVRYEVSAATPDWR